MSKVVKVITTKPDGTVITEDRRTGKVTTTPSKTVTTQTGTKGYLDSKGRVYKIEDEATFTTYNLKQPITVEELKKADRQRVIFRPTQRKADTSITQTKTFNTPIPYSTVPDNVYIEGGTVPRSDKINLPPQLTQRQPSVISAKKEFEPDYYSLQQAYYYQEPTKRERFFTAGQSGIKKVEQKAKELTKGSVIGGLAYSGLEQGTKALKTFGQMTGAVVTNPIGTAKDTGKFAISLITKPVKTVEAISTQLRREYAGKEELFIGGAIGTYLGAKTISLTAKGGFNLGKTAVISGTSKIKNLGSSITRAIKPKPTTDIMLSDKYVVTPRQLLLSPKEITGGWSVSYDARSPILTPKGTRLFYSQPQSTNYIGFGIERAGYKVDYIGIKTGQTKLINPSTYTTKTYKIPFKSDTSPFIRSETVKITTFKTTTGIEPFLKSEIARQSTANLRLDYSMQTGLKQFGNRAQGGYTVEALIKGLDKKTTNWFIELSPKKTWTTPTLNLIGKNLPSVSPAKASIVRSGGLTQITQSVNIERLVNIARSREAVRIGLTPRVTPVYNVISPSKPVSRTFPSSLTQTTPSLKPLSLTPLIALTGVRDKPISLQTPVTIQEQTRKSLLSQNIIQGQEQKLETIKVTDLTTRIKPISLQASKVTPRFRITTAQTQKTEPILKTATVQEFGVLQEPIQAPLLVQKNKNFMQVVTTKTPYQPPQRPTPFFQDIKIKNVRPKRTMKVRLSYKKPKKKMLIPRADWLTLTLADIKLGRPARQPKPTPAIRSLFLSKLSKSPLSLRFPVQEQISGGLKL